MTEAFLENPSSSRDGLHLAALLRGFAGSAVLAVDTAGRIVQYDAQLEQWTGLPPAAVKGKDYGILPAPLKAAVETFLKQSSAAEFTTEVMLGQPPATTRKLRLEARRFTDVAGGPLTLFILRDFSSLKQLEARVEQLDRLSTIGALSASIGHELRNRLVALRTFADRLLEEHPKDEFAGLTRRELLRMDATVGWLLDFSRQPQVNVTELHAHEVLDELLHLVHAGCDDRRVKIERDLQATRDVVRADEVQLQQALLNLLFNAKESMDHGGVLTVRTEVTGQGKTPEIVIRIADTGAGITPEVQARLFEPFFTTKPDGTGIGLPICHEIVTHLNGRIEVKSEPGRGSEFSVFLPLAQ